SSPATPFDVIKRPVDLTLSASPTDDVAGGGSTLTAKIRILDPISTDAVTGGIEFHDITGGGDVLVGTSPLSYVGSPDWNRATIDVSGLALGTHVYEARYAGSTTLGSDMATTNVVIGPQFSYVSLEVTPNPVLNTAHATATVTLSTGRKGSGSGGALPAATGTITLKRVSTGATIGTAPVSGPGPYTIQVPIYPTGTVGLVAEYSGDANFDPSTGNQVDLVVLTDVVDATGVGLGASTFYPVVDGYKDSVGIKGLRNEPISVEIRIYNSTNHLVRARSVASGTGAYSVYWNGRSTSGILQPGGTYRIVQTLTDAKSHHLVVSKTVAISRKKLYYTTKTLTKYADAAASVGHYGGGIAYKYSDHSVRAYASGGWVGIGWQFTLPSATTYKSLSVGIYGTSGTPIAHFGSQNFSLCSYSSTWSADCFDHMTAMRSTSAGNGWASRAVSPTYNRYGHAVRVNFSQYSGSSHFYKVRVIVTYGILK
ncbi:MAG TPA: hypothetical protein VHM48_01590, partial [Candidatus Limnocylindrales bacterium]|nr:hypothetical protein [Candidatus Limnocylindrales bacterium]